MVQLNNLFEYLRNFVEEKASKLDVFSNNNDLHAKRPTGGQWIHDSGCTNLAKKLALFRAQLQ